MSLFFLKSRPRFYDALETSKRNNIMGVDQFGKMLIAMNPNDSFTFASGATLRLANEQSAIVAVPKCAHRRCRCKPKHFKETDGFKMHLFRMPNKDALSSSYVEGVLAGRPVEDPFWAGLTPAQQESAKTQMLARTGQSKFIISFKENTGGVIPTRVIVVYRSAANQLSNVALDL